MQTKNSNQMPNLNKIRHEIMAIGNRFSKLAEGKSGCEMLSIFNRLANKVNSMLLSISRVTKIPYKRWEFWSYYLRTGFRQGASLATEEGSHE